jgi:ribosomal-protein-serine acetyltransferase
VENASTHLPLPEQITVNDEVVLRLLAESDAQELFRVVDDNRPHLGAWLPWVSANRAVADSLIFIRFVRAQFLASSGLSLAIFVRRELAGIITLRSLDWQNRSGEIGYWLAKKFQGRGIMHASCRSVLRCAFHDLGLHRVVIRCAPGNTRSSAIPERNGFVKEGTARGAELLNGTFIDLTVYSLLASEWKDNE